MAGQLQQFLESNNFSSQLWQYLSFTLNSAKIDINMSPLNYYFKRIYLLNLDRRIDRLARMRHILRDEGIYNWERWTAYDGKQEPWYSEYKEYQNQPLTRDELKRGRKKGIKSAGSWAIRKSMIKLLEHISASQKIDGNFQPVLILQDDLLFHKDFNNRVLNVLSQWSHRNWKLLYLGASQHNFDGIDRTLADNNGFYFAQGNTDGAFAVAINGHTVDELLFEAKTCQFSIDSGALSNIQRKNPFYCPVVYPNLIVADLTDSDLRKARNSSSLHWDMNLYKQGYLDFHKLATYEKPLDAPTGD